MKERRGAGDSFVRGGDIDRLEAVSSRESEGRGESGVYDLQCDDKMF